MQQLDNQGSIVDGMIGRVGPPPERVEIDVARAGGIVWTRDEAETTHDFLAQVRRAARGAGLGWVEISGRMPSAEE